MPRVWTFQDSRQKARLGKKAPWSVGWYADDGRKRSRTIGLKTAATHYARRLEGELAAGIFQEVKRVKWSEFREEYQRRVSSRKSPGTQEVERSVLKFFELHVKPGMVDRITTATIDDFISKRQFDPGSKEGSFVSAATINRDLRVIKTMLRTAADWGYLKEVPKFRMVREEDRIGRIVTPEHFQAIYESADAATWPINLPCSTGDWWRALLIFAITTGWRIEEIMSLRREDVDLETGAILTRAGDNKGKRDDVDHLPPVTLEHVREIVSFDSRLFAWPHDRRALWTQLERIQKKAGINLPCRDSRKHKCKPSCHRYAFHAFRRAYATLNADSMSAPMLQKKMRHKSFSTTLRYIGLADKMKSTAEKVHVPEFLAKKAT